MVLFSKPLQRSLLTGIAISSLTLIWSCIKRFPKLPHIDLPNFLQSTVQNSSFLALWTSIFSYLSQHSTLSPLLCGFLAGFTAQLTCNGISWEVALFCVLRAWSGVMDFPLKTHPFMSYAAIMSLTGYTLCYWFEYVNRKYLVFLQKAARLTAKQLYHMYRQDQPTWPPCPPIYHQQESCFEAIKDHFCSNMLLLSKFYLVVHTLPRLLSNKLKVERIPQDILIPVLRSSLFLSTQVSMGRNISCIARCFSDQHHTFWPSLVWFASSFSIFIEHPQRRSELALFCLWRLVETVINRVCGMSNGITPEKFCTPTLDAGPMITEEDRDEQGKPKPTTISIWKRLSASVLFGAASAIWLYCRANPDKRSSMKRLDRTIVEFLFVQ